MRLALSRRCHDGCHDDDARGGCIAGLHAFASARRDADVRNGFAPLGAPARRNASTRGGYIAGRLARPLRFPQILQDAAAWD